MALVTRLVNPDSFFKSLNGFFCLYKPPDMNLVDVLNDLKFCLVKGTNQTFNNKPKKYVKVEENQITLADDLSDRVESSGYRYVRKDFKINFLHPLKEYNSGIVVGTLNTDKGFKLEKSPILKIYEKTLYHLGSSKPWHSNILCVILANTLENNFPSAYQIKGRLGILTNDNTSRGSLVDRATYGHVNRSKMDRLMSTIQSVYQREILKSPTNIMGISAETYEKASKGIVIPKTIKTPPQIFEIKCIDFSRPFFKIELLTVNETENFLTNFIHSIGLKLKTYAICEQIRRIKYGPIDLTSNCLLQNEWKDFDVFHQNLKKTNKIFEKQKQVE